MPLTQLEENNLNTQIQLLKDIRSDNNMIETYLASEANNLFNIMRSASIKDKVVTMSSENFNKIYDFLSTIKNVNNWDEVHEFSKSYAIKKSVNEKTLSLLTKTN